MNALFENLNKLNEGFSTKVKLTEYDHTIEVNPITLSQHKQIIKTLTTGVLSETNFFLEMVDIIKQNLKVKEDFDKLNLLDYYSILLLLKMDYSGVTFTLNNDNINLGDVYNDLKLRVEELLRADEVVAGNLLFKVGIPTLKDAVSIETLNKNVDIKNEEELKDHITKLYVTEILKYIKDVLITQEDGRQLQSGYDTFDLETKTNVINRLSSQYSREIILKVEGKVSKINSIFKGIPLNANFILTTKQTNIP
jgi:hypothetical protein